MPRRFFPVPLLRAACCRNPGGATPENTHMAAAWTSLQPKRPHVAARPCGAFHVLGVAPVGPSNFWVWPPRGIPHFGRGASGPFHFLGVAQICKDPWGHAQNLERPPGARPKIWKAPKGHAQNLEGPPHGGHTHNLEQPAGTRPKFGRAPRGHAQNLEGPRGTTPKIWKGPWWPRPKF